MTRSATDVAESLAAVERRIAACGRDPRGVRIVAVTKGHGPEAVQAALAAGLRDIGENYADGLVAKAGSAPPASDVRWHYLGAVQRNKVARLAPFVAVWQTVDRADVAGAIARRSPGATALVQVNVAGVEGRNGCTWTDTPAVVDAARHAGLEVIGLMAVASPDPRAAEEQFGRLAALRSELGLRELSIGMSGDFELAVRAGSTIVRLGEVLFGARPAPRQVRR